MDIRKSLVNEKGWTVVSATEINHFKTFAEALAWQKITNGNLMATSFYQIGYLNSN